MVNGDWVETVGMDALQWMTVEVKRTVLVAVHTVTTAMRLADIVGLIESDPRVQVVYTQVPDVFGNGVMSFLRNSGALVVPWEQAVRTPFDLAVGASLHRLEYLHAPSLAVPHGAGYNKFWPAAQGHGPGPERHIYGLDAQSLVRGGRLAVSALVLSHADQLSVLRRQCPQAVPIATVAGDPCYDRLVASLPLRKQYREGWGLRKGDRLVAVTSTWGRQSLFGAHRHVLTRLLTELPPNHRVVATLHPAVWFGHGPRQVRAWLADCLAAGLELVGPGAEWRSLIASADYLVGDPGSVCMYGAAVGVPVLLTGAPRDDVDAGSALAALTECSPVVSVDAPMIDQLAAAALAQPRQREVMARRISSEPGQAARILRQTMYRLMTLSPPEEDHEVEPVMVL